LTTTDSLDDVDSLPAPDVIAAEIVENLQAALEAFQSVADELSGIGKSEV
jgi:type I restriction enzyme M protein